MATYEVKVPSTMEMGSYETIVSDAFTFSKHEEALKDYNDARDHDGLKPLKRMPKGTTYTRIVKDEFEQ